MNPLKQYGLYLNLFEVGAYFQGQSPVPIIPYNLSGDWTNYLPFFEHQANFWETQGCTVFGALNQIETFKKFISGVEENYSERFTYLLAGVTPQRGGDVQTVYEAIRRNGLIENAFMPMTRTEREFLNRRGLTRSLLARGQNWLVRHDFRHEWLWKVRPADYVDVMKRALMTSPLAVSVYAWKEQNGLFVSEGLDNNHWVLVYKIDDTGIYAYDHYDQAHKKLVLTHNINRVKRIWLNERTVPFQRNHVSILKDIIAMLTERNDLLAVATKALGTDASPLDRAPDELGCAETVCALLNQIRRTPPITGTATLLAYFTNPVNNFEEIDTPIPGALVISATGTGLPGTVGHVGIVMEDGTIASNDSGIVVPSNRGKFIKNYTWETWVRQFQERQKMPVRIFVLK